MMKRLLTILCIPAALLLLSSTEGWSLPPCEGSDISTWTNCFGTATHPNGQKYVGEFKDGKFNGHGTATFASGDKYVGEFEDGNFHGQGVHTFGAKSEWAGDKYVGGFKYDKRHGYGVYTKADGRVIRKGTWVYGEFLD